jgi:hypothetical protein
MRVFREMIDDDPSDPFARDDLAWAIWQCASLHYNPAALALSNEELAIEEQLVKEYPDSIEFRRDLSNALQFNQRLAITLSPTPQTAEKALAAFQRILTLRQAVLADLLSNRPEALQPQRPSHSEARLIYPGIMYTKRDVALAFEFAADTYVLQKDWPNAAGMYDQSASIYKELVESSPASATFADELAGEFLSRLIAARHANDRDGVVAWSRDAMEFWKRQAGSHLDLPFLRQQADDAAASNARIDQWFAARPPSTQP